MANHVFHVRSKQSMPPNTEYSQGGILLCYGSCEKCGWWCAIPQGGIWPDCPGCDQTAGDLLPQRLGSFDPKLYKDHPGGEPKAFVARFMTEREALEELTGRPAFVPKPRRIDRAKQLLKDLVGVRG